MLAISLIALVGAVIFPELVCGYQPGAFVLEQKIILLNNSTNNGSKINTTYPNTVNNNNNPNYARNGGNGNYGFVIPPPQQQPNTGAPPFVPYQPIHGNGYPVNQQVTTVNKPVNGKRSTVIGQCVPGDELVFQSIVHRNQKWYRSSVLEKEVVFPDKASKKRIREITCILLEDNTLDGKGGHAKVLDGGPGKPKVKVMFDSVPYKDIDITMTIRGYA